MAITRSFEHKSSGDSGLELITGQIERLVRSENVSQGIAVVFLPGSGAALMTISCPQGNLSVAQQALSEVLKISDNPHLLSNVLGTHLTFPIIKQSLPLATWQEIFLVDFLASPRWHQVYVQIMGGSH